MRRATRPEPGTVPYHRWRARQALVSVVTCGVMALVWLALNVIGTIWWVRPVHAVGLVWAGWTLRMAWVSRREQQSLAWQKETTDTLSAMAASGIYSFREALVALRDGPVPPGLKREDWQEAHDDMIRRMS